MGRGGKQRKSDIPRRCPTCGNWAATRGRAKGKRTRVVSRGRVQVDGPHQQETRLIEIRLRGLFDGLHKLYDTADPNEAAEVTRVLRAGLRLVPRPVYEKYTHSLRVYWKDKTGKTVSYCPDPWHGAWKSRPEWWPFEEYVYQRHQHETQPAAPTQTNLHAKPEELEARRKSKARSHKERQNKDKR